MFAAVPFSDVDHEGAVNTDSRPLPRCVQRQPLLHLDLESAKAGSSKTHIIVDGLDALHTRLAKAGTQILQPPTNQPWGLQEMMIADPDGNVFELAEPIRR